MKRFLSLILCLTLLAGSLALPVGAQDAEPAAANVHAESADDRETVTVYYNVDGDAFQEDYVVNEPVTLREDMAMRQFGNRMIVGWKTESGKEYYYDNTDLRYPSGETDMVLHSGETCTFYPIWCPIALTQDEVFNFVNADSYFDIGEQGTYLTQQHTSRFTQNWIAAFAWSPFAVPAALLGTFFMTKWLEDFHGACCGFAVSSLLQHYGKIDLLSKQGVSRVSELEPDEELISTLNYYNMQAAPCCIASHVALQPGTQAYSDQLHALYDTLAAGRPVYFEQYGDYPHVLRFILSLPFAKLRTERQDLDKFMFHGVVLTGAYTDDNGNHILIMYDNNSWNYVSGTCNVLYIDPDFTQIHSTYAANSGEILNGFTWNDTFDQYDSFKTEGTSNPFAWHRQFLKNLPSLARQIVTLFKTAYAPKDPA